MILFRLIKDIIRNIFNKKGRLYMIEECAQILGCSNSAICNLIYEKKLKYVCDDAYNFRVEESQITGIQGVTNDK